MKKGIYKLSWAEPNADWLSLAGVLFNLTGKKTSWTELSQTQIGLIKLGWNWFGL